MKNKLVILLLVTAALFFAAALPVSAATTADGYEYTVLDGKATLTGYQGSGGNLVIPSAISGTPVVAISAYCFEDCDTITGVTISDTVTSIGERAFLRCTALSSLTVGKSVTDMGQNAFKDCSVLTKVVWNAEKISNLSGKNIFTNAGTAGGGIYFIFGDNIETIPAYLFAVSGTDTYPNVCAVTIGKNVKTIGAYALVHFAGSSLVLPDSVETIGVNAFRAGKFNSVSFGKNLKEIGGNAFAFCYNLTSVTIPDSVTSIGTYAFIHCHALSQVNLGNGVEKIGYIAFMHCTALNEVTIPKSVSEIGDNAFGYYYDDADLERSDLTISGYNYSASQKYAVDNGFTFISLGGAFNDVPAAIWYEPSVDDLVAQGILSGYKNENGTYSFKPGNKITRAEFAVILAKASGEDLTAYKNKTSFTDVDASGWSGAGIEWAYQNGIVYGTGSAKYAPSANITRQDMAVMICRLAVHQSITLSPIVNKVTFADQSEITDYALNAVTTLQRAKIINGSISDGKPYFKPKDGATRAEAAIMISAFLDL